MEEHKKFGATDVYMLLAVLFWAINFSFIKIALLELSPLGFNGLRLVLTSVIFFIILLFCKDGFSFDRADIWKLVVLGIIGNTVFQWLFIQGMDLTTATNASIIVAMTPAIIAFFSSLVKHERLNWAAWLGIFISFVGFYVVITYQSGIFQFSWKSIRGDLMILGGGFSWALYTVFSKPLLKRISPLKLTAMTMITGTIFFLPFCLKDVINICYSEISPVTWVAILYSSIFALVICYVIWYASVKRIGNTKTAIYDNFVPVFTVISAYLILGERITMLQAGGALIIIMGVYLTRSGYRFFSRNK